MKNLQKIALPVVVALMGLSLNIQPVHAEPKTITPQSYALKRTSGIRPFLTFIEVASYDMAIYANNNMFISASVSAGNSVDSVLIEATVEYLNSDDSWTQAQKFSATGKDYANLEQNYTTKKGYTYRVKFRFFARQGFYYDEVIEYDSDPS